MSQLYLLIFANLWSLVVFKAWGQLAVLVYVTLFGYFLLQLAPCGETCLLWALDITFGKDPFTWKLLFLQRILTRWKRQHLKCMWKIKICTKLDVNPPISWLKLCSLYVCLDTVSYTDGRQRRQSLAFLLGNQKPWMPLVYCMSMKNQGFYAAFEGQTSD